MFAENVTQFPIDKEKELQFYKNLVEKLPFEIEYLDNELGIQMNKPLNEKPILTYTDSPGNLVINIPQKQDLPVELIEQHLTPILDLVPHHITFIDERGIVTFCNQQVAKDFKKDKSEIIGYHVRELLNLPDDQIEVLNTLKDGKEVSGKEVLDKNYGIMNTKLLVDGFGCKRVVGTFQFLNAIKDAERKGVAGRIAAGIAHEVRNPLTTVRGFLQILDDKVDAGVADIFKDLLIPEIDRANKIITDFLNVAKTMPTKKQKFSIKEFIEKDLYPLFQSDAVLHDVKLTYGVCRNLEKKSFNANKDEIMQVFLNLYKNSIEAAPKDKRLHVSLRVKIKNDRAHITFSDNGQGICQALVDCIFDPFFTTKDEGTGLGLSVSKKIIENHGGSMKVESSKKGTTFTIELPIEEE